MTKPIIQYQNIPITFKKKEVQELDLWKNVLHSLKLIGTKPNGVGYGNLSKRLASKEFIITGRGASKVEKPNLKIYTKVYKWDLEKKIVKALGPVRPSSESLAHGVVYDFDENLKFVIHAHSAHIWGCAKKLGLPVTKKYAKNCSVELATEIQRTLKETNAADLGLIVLGGHEPGILSFGKSSEEAGLTILKSLFDSLKILHNYNPISRN